MLVDMQKLCDEIVNDPGKAVENMNKLILEIENIKKSYSHKVVVPDESFSIYEGDVIGFIGPNGAD